MPPLDFVKGGGGQKNQGGRGRGAVKDPALHTEIAILQDSVIL